jgi:hypothetical protein
LKAVKSRDTAETPSHPYLDSFPEIAVQEFGRVPHAKHHGKVSSASAVLKLTDRIPDTVQNGVLSSQKVPPHAVREGSGKEINLKEMMKTHPNESHRES